VSDVPCQVDECLRRVRERAKVTLAPVDAPALAGHWTHRPGLTGSELYLFEDGTYFYTEWGCVHPETIHDKGRWRLDSSILDLTADQEVTWPLSRLGNRRYAALRVDGVVRLFGLDGSLRFFERFGVDQPADLLKFLSFSQATRWDGDKGSRTKAELLKAAWNPSYFDESERD
jgi:hypothetical protein